MKTRNLISAYLIYLILGCTSSPRYTSQEVSSPVSKIKSKSSNKKSIKNRKHKKIIYGVSSFYAEDFHGKLTANGEVYDMYGLTAAHKTLPLNTICRVTNQQNDKTLILRINDRGPYIKGRILDCSYGAAKKLDFIVQGTTDVKIEIIEWGDDKYMKHIDK